jgi:hypothetical protein
MIMSCVNIVRQLYIQSLLLSSPFVSLCLFFACFCRYFFVCFINYFYLFIFLFYFIHFLYPFQRGLLRPPVLMRRTELEAGRGPSSDGERARCVGIGSQASWSTTCASRCSCCVEWAGQCYCQRERKKERKKKKQTQRRTQRWRWSWSSGQTEGPTGTGRHWQALAGKQAGMRQTHLRKIVLAPRLALDKLGRRVLALDGSYPVVV